MNHSSIGGPLTTAVSRALALPRLAARRARRASGVLLSPLAQRSARALPVPAVFLLPVVSLLPVVFLASMTFPAPLPPVGDDDGALALRVSVIGVAGAATITRAGGDRGAPNGEGAAPDRDGVAPDRDGDGRARWTWPTGVAVVLRPWEEPDGDYGPGHRGIDVPGAIGSDAHAVDDGTVTFAGSVGGRGVVTIDHGGGLVSTLDSVTPSVRRGDPVRRGDVVGVVAVGHCPAEDPCLHLGARQDDRYVDPTPFLSSAEWPVLLPWE